MSKAVLISIHPRWCEKIAGGEKTIEVRKTRPKLETPFRCYIYCTMDHPYISVSCGELDKLNYRTNTVGRCNGKVIGEFTCDRIFPINIFDNGSIQNWLFEHMERSCLTYEELADYIGNGRTGYGWHISDLRIYDMPKELSEFTGLRDTKFGAAPYEIKRPPQSWCYVEAMEAESEEAALREVERRWKNGEYILDADNFQGVDFWAADHPPVKHIDAQEKIDWFELFLSRMRDYSDGEVWGNGDELMCKTEAIADAMCDLLFQLYAAQGEEVVFHTGYYDPVEDARSGEEDRCTGWWYVDCD